MAGPVLYKKLYVASVRAASTRPEIRDPFEAKAGGSRLKPILYLLVNKKTYLLSSSINPNQRRF